MREIQQTVERLRRLDDNIDFIMKFIREPGQHYGFIERVLQQEVSKMFNPESPESDPITYNRMMSRYDAVMHKINDQWWPYIYAAHEQHFHKNFKDFCNCPVTTLTEILDCLDKILIGN